MGHNRAHAVGFPIRFLLGDKAYGSESIRMFLKIQEVCAIIPDKSNAVEKHEFCPVAYKHRNIVERVFAWLKEYRRFATRFEKLAIHYLGFIQAAFIRMCLRKRF